MHKLWLAMVVTAAALIWPATAAAYLDPGTGSMLIQGLIAAFAVVSGGIAAYWTRIKMYFASRKGKPASASSDDSEPHA